MWWIDPPGTAVEMTETLLEDFVELADGDPKDVLKFARNHGVLMICEEHGLPASHNPQPRWNPA